MSFRRLAATVLLAFAATGLHAQASPATPWDGLGNTAVLPVWNGDDGKVSGLLLIEPSNLPLLPSQRVIRPADGHGSSLDFGNGLKLRAGLSLQANPGMGVVCNGAGVSSAGALAGQCLLTDTNRAVIGPAGRSSALKGGLQLQRGNDQIYAGLGVRRDSLGSGALTVGDSDADRRLLNSLLGPGRAGLDQNNASLVGQLSLGSQSWISIGGTVARVRLIPTEQLPAILPSEWNKGSLNLSGGVGRFGGEITGQLIQVPGQSGQYTTVGAGVTWRTPWKAKVSVGADNLLTRGKNPFGLQDAPVNTEEGRVPYVRYQQDL